MNIVMNLVLALQILSALVMIGLVLIQHGKGADMGASFGSRRFGQPVRRHRQRQLPVALDGGLRSGVLRLHAGPGLCSNDKPRASAGSVLDSPANGALPASGAASARPKPVARHRFQAPWCHSRARPALPHPLSPCRPRPRRHRASARCCPVRRLLRCRRSSRPGAGSTHGPLAPGRRGFQLEFRVVRRAIPHASRGTEQAPPTW